MTKFKIILSAVIAVILSLGTGMAAAPGNGNADIVGVSETVQDEYTAELRKYFTASGTDAAFPVMMETMMDVFKEMVTPEEFKIISQTIQTTGYEKLLELFTPIYRKHISLEDLKEINKFYATPAGKRLATALPKISAESMNIGQEWAMYIMSLFPGE